MEKNITTLSIEELVRQRQKAVQAAEDIESARKIIDEEIVRRLDEQKIQGTVVDEWTVKKVSGVRFNTKVDLARDLGATKTEERIDTKKLRQLYEAGVEVEGASPFSYLRVNLLEG